MSLDSFKCTTQMKKSDNMNLSNHLYQNNDWQTYKNVQAASIRKPNYMIHKAKHDTYLSGNFSVQKGWTTQFV